MKTILSKLVAIQGELKAPKGQYNNFGKYKYRSCEDILEAVKPLLVKHNLLMTITDDIILVGDRFYVKATVTITDGDATISNSALAREEAEKKGMDASQVTGACSSYARKYALNGMFCIDDTKDADATNTHEQQSSSAPKPKNDDYAKAIKEVNEATSVEKLMSIYQKYPLLHANKNFTENLTAKRKAIEHGL